MAMRRSDRSGSGRREPDEAHRTVHLLLVPQSSTTLLAMRNLILTGVIALGLGFCAGRYVGQSVGLEAGRADANYEACLSIATLKHDDSPAITCGSAQSRASETRASLWLF